MKSVGTKLIAIMVVNILLLAVFLVYSTYTISSNHARELTSEQARLALAFDLSIRKYVGNVIRPAMRQLVPPDDFKPETMSTSFVAREVFQNVREYFPDYILKFSSDNPRNPLNLADKAELEILDYFNMNPDKSNWAGEITINGRDYLATFQARRMSEPCLQCHGTPEDAPKSLIEQYGPKAGFNRRLGSVIAMDTIAIPVDQTSAHLKAETKKSFLVIGTGIAVFLLLLAAAFRFLVSSRLAVIADHFEEAARQDTYSNIKYLEVKGADEISSLANSFNALAEKLEYSYLNLEGQVDERTKELAAANEQLRIEIEKHREAEKALRESENRLKKTNTFYKTVLDSLNDAVSIIDVRDFRIVGANKIFMNQYNLSEKTTLGRKCHELTHNSSDPCQPPHDPCPLVKTFITGEHAAEEHTHFQNNGDSLHVEVGTTPIFNEKGDITQVVHVARDITSRKKYEMELIEARKEAEEASKAKSQFLANMSHEIRTPLNGIIGMSELAMDTDLDDYQRKIFNIINTEADLLLEIINDVLDFSKIEAGRLELETITFDLSGLVEDVTNSIAVRAEQKGLEFLSFIDPKIPSHLAGDPVRIRQILTNLAGNALKFTLNGEIFISVTIKKETADTLTVLFEVKDTGVGIPAEKQASIFDSFTQADGSTTREFGGTGLGTAISKQLVEMMGGEIGLESAENIGSTFCFTLVLGKVEGNDQPAVVTQSLEGYRILIVDDNKNNRIILAKYLESWGCIPVLAQNGRQALDLIQSSLSEKEPFQVIISDYQMPGMDGFELAGNIRAIHTMGTTPIIILTSVGNLEDAQKGRKIGIQQLLSKPVRRSDLLFTVSTALGIRVPVQNELAAVDTMAATSPAPENSRKQIRILLVEDYPTNQHLARHHLNKAGFTVVLAENGQEAVHAASTSRFDLVLMDIQMPVMDGYEATIKIREREASQKQDESTPRLPIIALTAHAAKEDQEKCLRAGMDDYLVKPLRQRALMKIIHKWLPAQTLNEDPFADNAEKEEAEEVHSKQTLDLEGLHREYDGDAIFLGKIMNDFIINAEKEFSQIEQALEKNDLTTVTKLAHALKGAALYIKAHDLSEAAFTVEEQARSGRADAIATPMTSLRENICRVKDLIKKAFA